MTAADVQKLLTRPPRSALAARDVKRQGRGQATGDGLVLLNDMLVGRQVANDGVPAEFDICPLLHMATIEPMMTGRASG